MAPGSCPPIHGRGFDASASVRDADAEQSHLQALREAGATIVTRRDFFAASVCAGNLGVGFSGPAVRQAVLTGVQTFAAR